MKDGETRRIGWVCSYTPLEIPIAGGLVPVRLEGGESLPRSQDPRIYQLMCPYLRAIFNKAVTNELPSLDAVVFTTGCDALRRLADLWEAFVPTKGIFMLEVPKIQTDEALCFFERGLRNWGKELEAVLNCQINDEDLHRAISDMNKLRKGFQDIATARKANPGLISFEDLNLSIRNVLGAGPNEGLALLEGIRERMKGSPLSSDGDAPKVFLMSTMLDQPKIIRMIEDTGIAIVSEDHCMGGRHFDGLVSESNDPYRALAERYLQKWPCARMKGAEQRFQWIEKEIEDAGVSGVIFLWLKYCDQSGFEIPLIKRYTEKRGLPLLVLENDYTDTGLGQLKVRIEAFAEILKGEF
jgi:benzoyl-CoA reductase/2-hydroxyglutaryl-CoA dehydratase subunit BcrC/BadD/HgdB